MCDMWDVEHECSGGTHVRGDLLVCDTMAKTMPANIGRVPGEVKCSCGYFRPAGTPCGEPCM